MNEDAPKREPLTEQAAADVRTVAKGGAVQIAGQVSQRGLSFIFNAVALQFLGRSGFGLYRQVAQVLALLAQIGLAGFNYASMRFITRARAAGRPGEVRGAALVGVMGSIVASIFVLGAALVGAELLAGVFADTEGDVPGLVRLIRIGAPYVPLYALMQVLRYCTQAYKTMVPSVIAGNIVQPAARFVIGLGALVLGFEVAGAIGSLVISVALGALVAGWYFARMLTPEERGATVVRPTGPMIRFALPQAGASLFGVQTLGLGVILLGLVSTNTQVAYFAVALSLQGLPSVFLGGIVNIWAPVVSDLYERGEIARLDALYKTINRWIATFSLPLIAVLILESDFFVRTFFPKAFPGAVAVAAVLAAGNIFYTGTGPTGYVISMTGRPGVNFANSVVAVVLYAVGGVLVIPAHGALGMAIVDAIVTGVINLARVVQAKILVGVQPFGRSFLKPVIATIVGSAVLLAWRPVADDRFLFEIAGIAIAAAVYLLVLSLLGVDPEERHVWEQIRSRVRRKTPH